jgi:hypothetical protein
MLRMIFGTWSGGGRLGNAYFEDRATPITTGDEYKAAEPNA